MLRCLRVTESVDEKKVKGSQNPDVYGKGHIHGQPKKLKVLIPFVNLLLLWKRHNCR